MDSNDEMVDYLCKKGFIETDRVEEAFRKVDRSKYVQEGYNNQVYEDEPIPIDENATISAPHMVARNTELMDLQENDCVLEIGSGSGYQLAILAELCRKVVGVEVVKELFERSHRRLSDRENVEIFLGNGFNQVEDTFDKILFSCAVEPKTVEKAKEHLNENGFIVAPVEETGRQLLKRIYKDGQVEDYGGVKFVRFKE